MMHDTRALDALLDRMLARRRELAANVPGVADFADVSSDPDLEELRQLRRAKRPADCGKTGSGRADEAAAE